MSAAREFLNSVRDEVEYLPADSKVRAAAEGVIASHRGTG